MMDVVRRWLTTTDAADMLEQPIETADEGLAPRREEEFAAYTADCRLSGFLTFEAERLTDALNAGEEFALDSVMVVALDDGRIFESRTFTVRREELIAVRAAGPRGNPSRRSRMRPSPVSLKAGPYVIHGYLHAPPGADPLLHIRRRRPMVPLTGAWIEYETNGQQHRARVGTILVNRLRIDWIGLSKDTDVRVDLPVETAVDPRAKDMTGAIRVWHDDVEVEDTDD